ncbi:hypothetical protein AB1N83_007550 [Pleurotus pulmonarius]
MAEIGVRGSARMGWGWSYYPTVTHSASRVPYAEWAARYRQSIVTENSSISYLEMHGLEIVAIFHVSLTFVINASVLPDEQNTLYSLARVLLGSTQFSSLGFAIIAYDVRPSTTGQPECTMVPGAARVLVELSTWSKCGGRLASRVGTHPGVQPSTMHRATSTGPRPSTP